MNSLFANSNSFFGTFRIQSRWESYTISILLHSLLLLFLYSPGNPPLSRQPQLVAVSFGDGFGGGGSAGGGGEFAQSSEIPRQTADAKSGLNVDNKAAPFTDLEQPTVKSEDGIFPATGNTSISGGSSQNGGGGFGGEGTGFGSGNGSGFGYSIDWGGRGQRRILSYLLPEYPSGVNKEVDIRVRFTILPDGAVGSTLILNKADTRLEAAAVNSLRRWRFEPLRGSQEQVAQVAVISFPYRLR